MRAVEPESNDPIERETNRGYRQLEEGDFEGALKTARSLEDLRNTCSFEIAALAKLGMEDPEGAIKVLKRGVELAPDVWVNWQLLGNVYSDLGRFEEAENAFRDALRCPEPWVESIALNQAVLLGHQGKYEAALERLAAIHDEDLAIEIGAARVNTLGRMGRREEAIAAAAAVLQLEPQTPSDEDAWYFVAALELRLRFELGLDPEEVRSRALALLRETSENEHALALIRDTRGERDKDNQYLRIVVHGNSSQADVSADGFYAPYDVVARDPEDALPYIEEIESARGFDHLEIEDCEVLAKRVKDPKGVYRVGGRDYYAE
ncbi:MAG: tetratricopeptide repeat protein [Planctomycetota bacterium]